MRTAIDHTDQREEESRHQTMGEHLHDSTGHRGCVEHQDCEEHQTAVADGRICVDILEVGLHTCAERTIDNGDTREDKEYPGKFLSGIRHQIDGDTEATVTTKFHEHAGMEHGHRSRSGSMTVGAPCVEGEHSTQHAEANECHREEEFLPAMRDGIVLDNLKNIPCQLTTFGSRMIVNTDQAEHQECGTTHEHQRQFHR